MAETNLAVYIGGIDATAQEDECSSTHPTDMEAYMHEVPHMP